MSAEDLVVASLLASFFDAGWSIQVLLGDADRAQYEASRIARPQVERHLQTMVAVARSLPGHVREFMPEIDWDGWIELGEHLSPQCERDRMLLWTAISAWLPPAGAAMRRYRREHPQLWRFNLG